MTDSPSAEEVSLEIDSGFLELESMASMHRVDESTHMTLAGAGSTLLDLDGGSADTREVAENARQNLAQGRSIDDRYRVLGEIARGGMGAVLEVQDADLDRHVAMKVMLRDTRRKQTDSGSPLDSGPVHRFIAEAQLTGALEHPNIVPVHELGLDAQNRVYFTMKRVRGRSLRQILDKLRQGDEKTHQEFDLPRLLNVLQKICDAVEFAHSRGIAHRDLKPENIMAGEFGEVLVMDWGLAKQIREPEEKDDRAIRLSISLGAVEDDALHTRDGTVSGTPAYMAPEQARGLVKEVDERTDVFCLGGVLYEMLALVPPFLAPTVTTALDLARDHKLLAPRTKLDEVLRDRQLKRAFHRRGIERGRKFPPELAAIAMKAMSETREKRYPGVADLRRDIENFLAARPVSAWRDNLPSRLNKWARRNPTRAAVLTLSLVVLLLGGAIGAGVWAKTASTRADLAEEARLAQEQKQEELEKREAAEKEARENAEKAAALERERRKKEEDERLRLEARRNAFIPYSRAADLLARSASFSDWQQRAEVWREAAALYQKALEEDPDFVEAHVELARVYADLGYDEEALHHFSVADSLSMDADGRGHVEARMAYVMYDLQRKILTGELPDNLDDIFRRFELVREAAEPGSSYARIAQVLLDLAQAYRQFDAPAFRKFRNDVPEKLKEIERDGTAPLWEVHALLALFDVESHVRSDRSESVGSHLEHARRLKPNLPLLTWLENRRLLESTRLNKVREGEHRARTAWDAFVEAYPYDPRGYYSRAAFRFRSRFERNAPADIEDLQRAIFINPRFTDACRLLLAVYTRDGDLTAADDFIHEIRRSVVGPDHSAIDLMVIEHAARIGDFERIDELVLYLFGISVADGAAALAEAGRALMKDHEYQVLADLCDHVIIDQMDSAPALAWVLKARSLGMLAEFDEAREIWDEILNGGRALDKEFRRQAEVWADDMRRIEKALSGTSVPDSRDKLDVARVRALRGDDPDLWIFMLNQQGQEGLGAQPRAADQVLRARGFMLQAAAVRVESMRDSKRQHAVDALADAFEGGYLDRRRIESDPLLAELATDEKLSPYFVTR